MVLVIALAGPLAAETDGDAAAVDQQTHMQARLGPLYVGPGGDVTVTSVDRCPGVMQVFWNFDGTTTGGSGLTDVNGGWTVRFQAPIATGVHTFTARCALTVVTTAEGVYDPIEFTVVARRPPRYTG
jgi:hypothetical protein